MILARSIAMSLAVSTGRTTVVSWAGATEAGEFAPGCCAFSTGRTAKIEKKRATRARSFLFMAKPPDAALAGWILCPLVWLVGILLASPRDTKNAPEKTFFLLFLGLRLTLRRLRCARSLCGWAGTCGAGSFGRRIGALPAENP